MSDTIPANQFIDAAWDEGYAEGYADGVLDRPKNEASIHSLKGNDRG